MAAFIRIKDHFINLEAVAYIKIEKDAVSFTCCGSATVPEAVGGQNYLRFERGVHLQDAELKQLKEFILELPSLDRVLAI